jgi:hypothetical protein
MKSARVSPLKGLVEETSSKINSIALLETMLLEVADQVTCKIQGNATRGAVNKEATSSMFSSSQ